MVFKKNRSNVSLVGVGNWFAILVLKDGLPLGLDGLGEVGGVIEFSIH